MAQINFETQVTARATVATDINGHGMTGLLKVASPIDYSATATDGGWRKRNNAKLRMFTRKPLKGDWVCKVSA